MEKFHTLKSPLIQNIEKSCLKEAALFYFMKVFALLFGYINYLYYVCARYQAVGLQLVNDSNLEVIIYILKNALFAICSPYKDDNKPRVVLFFYALKRTKGHKVII